MKITVEKDGGGEVIYTNVLDYFLAVRQPDLLASKDGKTAREIVTRSYSEGSNLRELVKEVRQALVELERLMAEAPKREPAPL